MKAQEKEDAEALRDFLRQIEGKRRKKWRNTVKGNVMGGNVRRQSIKEIV